MDTSCTTDGNVAPSLNLPFRLRPMAAYFTSSIITAAARRVMLGERLPSTFRREEKKAALLLVREFNPDEILLAGEEAILRGVRSDTLKGYKDRGELPQVIGYHNQAQMH